MVLMFEKNQFNMSFEMTSDFNYSNNQFFTAFLKRLAGSLFKKSLHLCNFEDYASLGLTVKGLREHWMG